MDLAVIMCGYPISDKTEYHYLDEMLKRNLLAVVETYDVMSASLYFRKWSLHERNMHPFYFVFVYHYYLLNIANDHLYIFKDRHCPGILLSL